eukprot:CAMPEP_0168439366 /NCGR_PEP_ID=MMETSP0228-20121227/42428_1 /TAXON_ID=133427 /ORGANISM="Protoceratium reticulatum, Strain CCCM 535 (=CCMP 1889)" /LENGTH=130 /DNA_ID=CAMNT_0008453639 /DNA_START=47 /DNA_END=436 /DNA_ORIENTATION=+
MAYGGRVAALLALLVVLEQPQLATAGRRADSVRKMIAAKHLVATGLPDPKCHTGVISMKTAGQPQVCCAGYCGECSDYPTCERMRGQNSTNACCKTQVLEMRCGNAAANVCLKPCSESVPPCILDEAVVF